jgi:hypothetical protein
MVQERHIRTHNNDDRINCCRCPRFKMRHCGENENEIPLYGRLQHDVPPPSQNWCPATAQSAPVESIPCFNGKRGYLNVTKFRNLLSSHVHTYCHTYTHTNTHIHT